MKGPYIKIVKKKLRECERDLRLEYDWFNKKLHYGDISRKQALKITENMNTVKQLHQFVEQAYYASKRI